MYLSGFITNTENTLHRDLYFKGLASITLYAHHQLPLSYNMCTAAAHCQVQESLVH